MAKEKEVERDCGKGLICPEEGAKQSFKDECDVNVIMRRYEKTGRLPELMRREPMYGDFSTVPDFQQAFEIVQRAEMQFSELSAEVRDRFHNDPVEFLAFVNDGKNVKELIQMGLAVEIKDKAPGTEPIPTPASGTEPVK